MDGILIIDKPVGMTSHDVVYKVRKALHEKAIGHTGTLDPSASGVLVLCIGNATKLVKYFTEHEKTYQVGIALGYATTTLDQDGEITATLPCSALSEAQADGALSAFVGSFDQMPPAYSAIKVDGKKLYEYARKNEEMPEIAFRHVVIHDLWRTSPVTVEDGIARFAFFVHCGKGMYVRALCRDIGEKLGSLGTMTALRRLSVGTFGIGQAERLEAVQNGVYALLEPLQYLNMPKLVVDDAVRTKAKNGVFLSPALFPNTEETILYDQSNIPLAIYAYDEMFKMMRLSVLL
jgi:tRNA pseudouridine55 synthase